MDEPPGDSKLRRPSGRSGPSERGLGDDKLSAGAKLRVVACGHPRNSGSLAGMVSHEYPHSVQASAEASVAQHRFDTPGSRRAETCPGGKKLTVNGVIAG